MIRLGILGAESSHAKAFAEYFLEKMPSGRPEGEEIRISAVLDDGPQAAALAGLTGAALVSDAQVLAGQVDAALITARRGSAHMALAQPLAERGLPLFIDKPFASSPADARALAALLQAHGCPVQGGSGCRLSPDVQALSRRAAALAGEGRLLGAGLCFGIDLDSPYDGFYFYAPHLVEMALEIFGERVLSVNARRQGKNLTALLHYGAFSVSLHFLYASQAAAASLYTDDGCITRTIDISGIYDAEAARFAGLLRGTEKGLTAVQLVRPIEIIDAILRSDAADGAAVTVPPSVCLRAAGDIRRA